MPANGAVFTRETLARLTGHPELEEDSMAAEIEAPARRGAVVIDQEVLDEPDGPNDLAVRLWQLDQATAHLTRNAGVLGLAGNMLQQSLRAEKNHIIRRLQALAPAEN